MTGIPFQITPPASLPVSLLQAKDNSRITHDDEDAVIEGMIAAAVGYLDGWGGMLGRCIMPQTWAQEWTGGPVECLLAMPDATVTAVKVDGVAVLSEAYTTERTARGLVVTLDGVAGDVVRVEYSCGMGPADLAVAQRLVLLMVGDAYVNREGGGGAGEAIASLTSRLRWGRL